MTDIKDARILILAMNGLEQFELTVPRDKLRKAGARVDVASSDGMPIRSGNENDRGETAAVDLKIADAKSENYQALVLPGRQINTGTMRGNPAAMMLVKAFFDSGKPVTVIGQLGAW